MITIDINSLPVMVNGVGQDHQQWQAWLDGELLCTAREPLFAAARVLQARGIPDDTPIASRHKGAAHISLTSTFGKAAKLTVRDNRRGVPKIVPFETYPDISR